MNTQQYIGQIKAVVHDCPGYSLNEEELWEHLAINSTPNEQKEIKRFLEENSKKLSPDFYDIYEQKGVLDQLELAFFDAQTNLSPKSEQKSFFEMLFKNGKVKPSKKMIEKTLNLIKSEKDITNLLITLGPKGIEELEAGLVNLYLSGKLDCSLSELLEILHEYINIKNVITQGNIKFMEDIIEIYTKVINQLNEQRGSALKRAEYIISEFLKTR